MRQIPMLFKPEMIQAMLEGRKTETRRILKPQPDPMLPIGGASFMPPNSDFPKGCWMWRNGHDGAIIGDHIGHRTLPGDLIWAKETFYAAGEWVMTGETTASGQNKARFDRVPDIPILYADQVVSDGPEVEVLGTRYIKRPSLFMEKADSRLTLRVEAFNIERLHDMGEDAAEREGFEEVEEIVDMTSNGAGVPMEVIGHRWRCSGFMDDDEGFESPLDGYQALWGAINGTGAWDRNPWVEATRFEVIERNVLEVAA